jgi:hypothetical protein
MIRIAMAGIVLAATAAPALAAERTHQPHQVSAALKAGCKVHQVHLPAGKTGSAPALIHCDNAKTQLSDARPAAPKRLAAD